MSFNYNKLIPGNLYECHFKGKYDQIIENEILFFNNIDDLVHDREKNFLVVKNKETVLFLEKISNLSPHRKEEFIIKCLYGGKLWYFRSNVHDRFKLMSRY